MFEGSEKKVEIVVDGSAIALRKLELSLWKRVVETSGALIQSQMRGEEMDSYILSESSLFVWDDRLLMLTCGRTRMVESILMLIEELGSANIKSLIYQRKNEFASYDQPSSFVADVERLREKIDGVAMRFGRAHDHHNFVFHLERDFVPTGGDSTFELLMYDTCRNLSRQFMSGQKDSSELRQLLQLNHLVEGYQIDDYCFEPFGYSLNAIKGSTYYTVHITPEEDHPYISLETNDPMDERKKSLIHDILGALRPMSFDVMWFDSRALEGNGNSEEMKIEEYDCQGIYREVLSIGYNVQFSHYRKSSGEVGRAYIF